MGTKSSLEYWEVVHAGLTRSGAGKGNGFGPYFVWAVIPPHFDAVVKGRWVPWDNGSGVKVYPSRLAAQQDWDRSYPEGSPYPVVALVAVTSFHWIKSPDGKPDPWVDGAVLTIDSTVFSPDPSAEVVTHGRVSLWEAVSDAVSPLFPTPDTSEDNADG